MAVGPLNRNRRNKRDTQIIVITENTGDVPIMVITENTRGVPWHDNLSLSAGPDCDQRD